MTEDRDEIHLLSLAAALRARPMDETGGSAVYQPRRTPYGDPGFFPPG